METRGQIIMTSAEHYRMMAWDCLTLAEGTSDPETRVSMVALARAWRELAEQSDRSNSYRVAGYQAKAWECVSLAESTNDPERRADLLGFGRLWMSLAEPIEPNKLRGAYELPMKRAA